jgi:hypothetical protein
VGYRAPVSATRTITSQAERRSSRSASGSGERIGWRTPSGSRWGGLQRQCQPLVERLAQRSEINADADLSGVKDGVLSRIEQYAGEVNGGCDPNSELGVQLANDGEAQDPLIWDATCYALADRHNLWEVVLRKNIVCPLAWCSNRKCSNGNVIESHTITLLNNVIYYLLVRIKITYFFIVI